MGLGQKAEAETALWSPVINKSTGKPYAGLERCSSLAKLEEEDKVLSDLLDEKLNAWMAEGDVETKKAELKDFKKGFNYKHTDGFTYKIIQFDNGNFALSRSKQGAYSKGGYSKGAGYIHLRTVSAKECRIEQLAVIIDNQEANDNWEIIQLQPDAKGDKFLLLNKKPYTPTPGETSGSEAKTESKTESEEETESTTVE